jgi:hypothetical protein
MTDIDQINRSINLCETCGFDFRIFGTSAESQLAAEIARFRAELADMREIAENWEIKAKQTDIKLAAWQHARQDVESMRTALTIIADWDRAPITGEWRESLLDIIRSICDCARAALQGAAADSYDGILTEYARELVKTRKYRDDARQDAESMRKAILSMIPSLDQLITDYQCVPDASDGDGQSVFDDARTALAKARAALQGAPAAEVTFSATPPRCARG